MQVRTWGNTARSVDLLHPSDVETLLVVRENVMGWTAHVGDTALRPVRVDGWAQAWVVPAGMTGTADLRFAPQRTFLLTLAVGAVMALVLAAMALLAGRAGTAPVLPERVAPTAARVGAATAIVLVGGLTGVVVAILALLAGMLRRRPDVGLVLAGTAAVAWVEASAAPLARRRCDEPRCGLRCPGPVPRGARHDVVQRLPLLHRRAPAPWSTRAGQSGAWPRPGREPPGRAS